jgi:aminoglycoside 3-N-acetyltransferase
VNGEAAPCAPINREQLVADLRALGVRRGEDLLIHCSLRLIGPVDGGAATLLAALIDVAGPQATLVVPTHTTLNSLTSRAHRAAVAGRDDDELARYIADMPGFDRDRTPSQGMGALAEQLRTSPSAVRSHHPITSFSALGRRARDCTSIHDLDSHLGDRSPLGWLYAADAAILLLGVEYTACTAFHLAEYHLPWPPPVQLYHCFSAAGGNRDKREFTAPALDDSDFGQLGTDLEAAAPDGLRVGNVGSGTGRLVPVRAAVDFGVEWLTCHRRPPYRMQPLRHFPYSRPVPTMVPVPMGGKGSRGDY